MIIRLLTLLFIFSFIASYGASQKQLDAFRSNGSYYTAANPGGSGTISTSINTTTFKEGTSSLKIDYSLNASAGNFVEIYNNYGTRTQDFSFMPDKLSLWVKG